MPGGTVKTGDDEIEITDAAGGTVWSREKLKAPVIISYEVTVVSAGGPRDRVSDVNCFFLATDPKAPDGCPFAPGHGRTGKFEDYHSLRTYYVGMGGNANTTTRFRRYAGDGTKPLLPEHDLKDSRFLLEPNKTYRIEIAVRDGEVFFSWRDSAPLTQGWFGFRLGWSHQVIRNFKVKQL